MKHYGTLISPLVRLWEMISHAFRGFFAPCRAPAFRYALLLVMALGAAFQASRLVLPPPYGERLATRANEWQSIKLADGSIIHIGPNTRLNVRYRASFRRIDFRHGEAVFEVAMDPSKPFTVVTRAGEVRAIGTEFRVTYAPPNDMRVEVLQGVVNVTQRRGAPRDSHRAEAISLDAGKMASLSSNDVVISQPGDTRRVRWKGNALEVHGAALGEVVAQLNLRTGPKIVIDDPSVAALTVGSMLLSPYDAERFSSRIAASLNVVEYRRDGVLHLTRPD